MEENANAGVEIERRFLLGRIPGVVHGDGQRIRQWYLAIDEEKTVRIRIAGEESSGEVAFLTVKGKGSGCSRPEKETRLESVAVAAATEEYKIGFTVEKIRFRVDHVERGGNVQVWEVDLFLGENEGLIVAEAEIPAEDHPLEIPEWAGREITLEKNYSNAALAKNPYSRWQGDAGVSPRQSRP